MSVYLLDTNIVILYLADDPAVVRFIDELRAKKTWLHLSVISAIELFASKALQEGDEVIIQQLLSELDVIALNPSVAYPTAVIRRTTGLKLGDAAIAATAQARHLTLITRDRELVHKLKKTSIETKAI